MNNSSLPQEAKPTSKLWKYAKRTVIGIVTLLVIIIVAVIVDVSNDPKPDTSATQAENTAVENAPAPEPVNVVVTSQIIKKVGGKHRYFFDIRNNDSKDFEGVITIELLGTKGNVLGRDTFTTKKIIKPSLGDSVYFDINTGPISTFGEYGIEKYHYEVKVDNHTVHTGDGAISSKLEDLSGN